MKNTSSRIKDVPRKLQFELLQKATNYFSEERKLGCGTFGQVYKVSQNQIIYLAGISSYCCSENLNSISCCIGSA